MIFLGQINIVFLIRGWSENFKNDVSRYDFINMCVFYRPEAYF